MPLLSALKTGHAAQPAYLYRLDELAQDSCKVVLCVLKDDPDAFGCSRVCCGGALASRRYRADWLSNIKDFDDAGHYTSRRVGIDRRVCGNELLQSLKGWSMNGS